MKKKILWAVLFALIITAGSAVPSMSESLDSLKSTNVGTPTPVRQLKGNLKIDKAVYGAGEKWLDVTKKFSALIKPSDRTSGDWLFYSESAIWYQMGDPVPGKNKQLLLDYTIDGVKHHEEYNTGKWPTMIKINLPYPQDLTKNNWTLLKAEFGIRGQKTTDITEGIKKYIFYGELDWCPWDSYEAFGDPLPGILKYVYVDYVYDGISKSIQYSFESKEWIRIHGNTNSK
ncbi:MAG: hypothetical protein M0Q53_19105 [Prolixibacteraceae bacterium]|jgi:hypothetical protein|nr:hypothetical protein [Prolixibacteraceae bacterium]